MGEARAETTACAGPGANHCICDLSGVLESPGNNDTTSAPSPACWKVHTHHTQSVITELVHIFSLARTNQVRNLDVLNGDQNRKDQLDLATQRHTHSVGQHIYVVVILYFTNYLRRLYYLHYDY